MKQLIYNGFIKERDFGENDQALFIGEMPLPLVKEFEECLKGRQVSVRYWVSAKEKSKDQIKEDALRRILGFVDAKYDDIYTESTGYLWTTEDLSIGGHDVIKELRSHAGKFVYLEVDVHE